MKLLFPALLAASMFAQAQKPGWWMMEPIRWFQTNLRETDAALDAKKLVEEMADFRVNVLHINVGGIVAFYPTKLDFHYASPYMPPGADLIGDTVREAHARRVRVVGRFDLSKTQKPVFDAHPEWFFRQANGEPVIYNGLYSTCINGGYYRGYAMSILGEALDRYELDGLFFNMFGNQSRDYSGRFVGHCHCESCKRKYRQMYNRELPAQPDEQYQQFLFVSSREVAAEIGRLIRAKRPNVGYFNYIQEYTDGIMSESNTAISRPLPLWPYQSSDNVNRARNSEPGKMSVNLCMQFVDYAWRFATVPQQEIVLRLWQNIAHGGALALAINGSTKQEDRQAMEAARPVFQWAADHEQYYAGQQNVARVLLLGASRRTGRNYSQTAYRGIFRLLSEEHIPFAVSDNLDWIGKRDFDLVIATEWAPAELESYVANGGRLLLASSVPPEFTVGKIVKRWKGVEGYLRVRSHLVFPSLKQTNLVMLNGDYIELEPEGPSPLTLVPPSMIGPPEKIHVDQTDTDKPGLIARDIGKGKLTWLPWDAGTLYYRHSLPAHGVLIRDLIDGMLPRGRQIKTNAHPLVEFSLMRQGNRTLLHMVNLSGHSGTAYFAPIAQRDVSIKIAGKFVKAATLRSPSRLRITQDGDYAGFTVPRLEDYEVVVLE